MHDDIRGMSIRYCKHKQLELVFLILFSFSLGIYRIIMKSALACMSITVWQVRLKMFGHSMCSLVFPSDFRRGRFRLL